MDGHKMTESVVSRLLGEDGMYNPEVLKLIQKIDTLLQDLTVTVADSRSIPTTLKIGIEATLKEIDASIKTAKDLVSLPIDEDTGKIDPSGVGSRPVIELEDMTLLPASKEVVIDGHHIRLPRAEFIVLYSLASRAGQEVLLGKHHSLLTRLSAIRRTIPSIKPKIESLGRGKYILNCKFKG
jgi:hypothetical protein